MFDGISSIVQALRDNQASLAQKNFQLETTFTVSSIVLSALQLAMAGEGADTSAVAANCHHKVACLMIKIVRMSVIFTCLIPPYRYAMWLCP